MSIQGGGAITHAKTVFSAEDKTQAGVAKVNSSLGTVEASAKRSTKAVSAMGAASTKAEKATQASGGGISAAFDSANQRINVATQGAQKFGQTAELLAKAWKPAAIAIGAVVAGFQAAQAYANAQRESERIGDHLQVSIEGAREALGGYIDNVKLGTLANTAFYKSVVSNGEDLAKLSAGVAQYAKDRGLDVTTSMEQAIDAIASRDTAALANFGVTLDQASAEEQYAETLGRSVESLTAYQRAQAFSKVAVDRLAESQRDATKANESFSETWDKGAVSLANVGSKLAGFVDSGGGIRERLREVDVELLKLVGSERIQDIRRVERGFQAVGLTMEEVTRYVAEANDIEQAGGFGAEKAANNAARRLEIMAGVADLAAEAAAFQDQEIKKAEILAELAAKEAQEKANSELNSELEHAVALAEAMGESEERILELQEEALSVRIAQAEAAGDQAAALDASRKLELILLAAQTKKEKGRGGGGGPTRADRERAAGERLLATMDQELRATQALARLHGTEADSRARFAAWERENKLASLDLELRILGITKAKNAVEREKLGARAEAIEAEKLLLVREAEIELLQESNRLVAEAVTLSQAQAANAAKVTDRQLQANEMLRGDTEARIDYEAELALMGETNSLKRLDIETRRENELAAIARKRLSEEGAAQKAALDARQAVLDAQSGGSELEKEQRAEEYRQLAHDREMQRVQQQMDARRLLEQEKVNQLNSERARSEAQWELLAQSTAQFEQMASQVSEFASFVTSRRNEAQDAEHAAMIQGLNAQNQARSASYEREIAAAKGNTQAISKIKARQAVTEQKNRAQVEKLERQHQERRRKQEMRSEGASLLIKGAVAAVNAAISFAQLNIPQGILHTAAAAFAFVQGGILMSGNIPGGGGPSGGGGGGGMSAGVQPEAADPSNIVGSTPGQAANRASATPTRPTSETGGNTVNIGKVEAWGSIDSGVAEEIGRAVNNVSRSKEA
jgi:hypothetical protein